MSGQAERKYVNWTKDGAGIATMVVNNPPVNALSGAVAGEIKQCVDEIAIDSDVVAVVVTGAGEKAFMAGADIKEFFGLMKPGGGKSAGSVLHVAMNALDLLPKPTIAAIHGVALGGGLELALACDMRVAAANAQLGLPEVKLGLIPGAGGTQRLPRLIGAARAKEMIFTGNPITADEAYRIGLVNRVVPAGEHLAAAQELAKIIATRSGSAIALAIQAIDQGARMPLLEGLNVELECFEKAFLTEDVKEGVDAFVNKRPAQFKHR